MNWVGDFLKHWNPVRPSRVRRQNSKNWRRPTSLSKGLYPTKSSRVSEEHRTRNSLPLYRELFKEKERFSGLSTQLLQGGHYANVSVFIVIDFPHLPSALNVCVVLTHRRSSMCTLVGTPPGPVFLKTNLIHL